jgi:hypothetical protein
VNFPSIDFKPRQKLSALLPPEARLLLARAAQEAQQLKDELAREVHIAEAIARVRLQYPQFFKD